MEWITRRRKFMVKESVVPYTGDREFIIHLGRDDHGQKSAFFIHFQYYLRIGWILYSIELY
ncbi:hypothetical protein CN621_23755 [Bacillus wiedmannii]|nr:hypothetical protein CN621_23755 [Bacillus wiedmannii]PHD24613.1 hypothetical protein COF58_16110 [Bacillus wiedmannii]